MIGAFAAAPAPPSRAIVDPGLLTYRDRAALRILYRADVATTTQLTTLVYHRRQSAQERLARLYRAGYLERAILPPVTRGGAPFAFRISPRGRRRLHYGRSPAAGQEPSSATASTGSRPSAPCSRPSRASPTRVPS